MTDFTNESKSSEPTITPETKSSTSITPETPSSAPTITPETKNSATITNESESGTASRFDKAKFDRQKFDRGGAGKNTIYVNETKN